MFDPGTLKAQRFLTAVDMKHPKYLEEVSRQMWLRLWSRVRNLGNRYIVLKHISCSFACAASNLGVYYLESSQGFLNAKVHRYFVTQRH